MDRYDVFGYKATIKKKGNAYHVRFKSRIIGRYLNKFLDFPIGKKTDIVKEPQIIKQSSLNFRKAFALGVMTFDGSVDIRGKVTIQLRSKMLILELYEILNHENVLISLTINPDKLGRYHLQSGNFQSRLLHYFDENSMKYQRLSELTNGFQKSVESIQEAKQSFDIAFPKTSLNLVTFSDILDKISNTKEFTFKEIMCVLKDNNINISETTLRYYLRIFENNKIINCEKNKVKLFRINNDINEWRVPYRLVINNEKL